MASESWVKKKWAFLIPILIAVGVLVIFKLIYSPNLQANSQVYVKPVSVIPVQTFKIVPRISSFAYVQPAKTWEAVAEISGKIVYRHPDLEKGAVFGAGEVVIRIDATDYELNLAVSESNLEVAKQQLQEAYVRKENFEKSLAIERESLTLSEAELERIQELQKRNAVGKSDLDAQKIKTLIQRQKIQDLENQYGLVQVQIGLLGAQLAKAESELSLNEKNLQRTEIIVPYDCRISDVMVDEEQFVSVGEKLAIADDISVVEIEMQVLPQHLEQLARSLKIDKPVEINAESFARLRKQFGLEGRVVLTRDDRQNSWPARFMRISNQLDPKTHTLGVFFEVDNPYKDVLPGVRPPLIRGQFVEIFFFTQPQENVIAIPRVALREDNVVYLVKDNQVDIRPVKVGLRQPGFVTIVEGLTAGELLITSQIPYVVENMPVLPVEDQLMGQRLADIVAF